AQQTDLPSAHSMVEPGRNRHPEQNSSKKWLRSQFLDSCRQRNPALPLKRSNPVAGCFRNQWRDLRLQKNRGAWEPLELFLGGVRDWEAGLRRALSQVAHVK